MKIVLDSRGKDEIPSLTRNGMARVLEAYSLKEENRPLTAGDVSDLKSQIATSSWGEVRKSPTAFARRRILCRSRRAFQ